MDVLVVMDVLDLDHAVEAVADLAVDQDMDMDQDFMDDLMDHHILEDMAVMEDIDSKILKYYYKEMLFNS